MNFEMAAFLTSPNESGEMPLHWQIIIAVGFGTVLGRVILNAACGLFNRLTGGVNSQKGVPRPTFVKGLGIAFVHSLIMVIIPLTLESILRPPGTNRKEWLEAAEQPAAVTLLGVLASLIAPYLVASLMSIVVMGAMCQAWLPTTLGRGITLAVCYQVLAVLAGIVLASVVCWLLGASHLFFR